MGGVFGWVFGWVLNQHPPSDFPLFIGVLRDLGGCWGVFAKNSPNHIFIYPRSIFKILFVFLRLIIG